MILLKSGAIYNYRVGSGYNHFLGDFDNFLFVVKNDFTTGS
jgi:hypothetical protein